MALTNHQIRQLLGRPVSCDPVAQLAKLSGQRICVTGAGGSIGSRISEILAEHHDDAFLLLDRHDANLFQLERRLGDNAKYAKMRLVDVTNRRAINFQIQAFRPDIVIHAAAYKHVAMLQNQVDAAYRNNVGGTAYTLSALESTHAGKFVLISTDKAVHPAGIMGWTKRMAEITVMQSREVKTAVVRFGNVLGSSGSVLELWEEAHQLGKPIVVTDSAMRRYFMTFDEAATLVFAACAHRESGVTHVPDIGHDIAITDLAARFIALRGSGRVEISSAASGEKTVETMSYENEVVLTHHLSA